MQLDLTWPCQNRCVHIGKFLVDWRDSRVASRFAHAGDAQDSARDEFLGHLRPQSLQYRALEQRFQLIRRPGKKDDDLLLAVGPPADPLSWRGSIRVHQYC